MTKLVHWKFVFSPSAIFLTQLGLLDWSKTGSKLTQSLDSKMAICTPSPVLVQSFALMLKTMSVEPAMNDNHALLLIEVGSLAAKQILVLSGRVPTPLSVKTAVYGNSAGQSKGAAWHVRPAGREMPQPVPETFTFPIREATGISVFDREVAKMGFGRSETKMGMP